jgi:hypothetical protein
MKSNSIALRRGIFQVTKKIMGVEKLDPATPGYEVNLGSAVAWIAREMRLHGHSSGLLESKIMNIVTSRVKAPNFVQRWPILLRTNLKVVPQSLYHLGDGRGQFVMLSKGHRQGSQITIFFKKSSLNRHCIQLNHTKTLNIEIKPLKDKKLYSFFNA